MKTIIILGLILLVLVGIIVYQTIFHDDKATPTIQYSSPIGPTQDGKGLPSTSLIVDGVNK